MEFKVQKAVKNIFNLEKHLLRCKNQDMAKDLLFDTMGEGEVLLICD